MTTTNWTGTAADGLWATAGNWSAGVPTALLDVTVTGSNAISAPAGVVGKTFDFTGYSGALTIVGAITASGSVTLEGAATYPGLTSVTFVASGTLTTDAVAIPALSVATGFTVTLGDAIGTTALTITGGGTLNCSTRNITLSGALTGGNASITATGRTIAISGACTLRGTSITGGAWNVTGTAKAYDGTMTGCTFAGGTALTATNCTDGGTTTSVTFVVPATDIYTPPALGLRFGRG